MLHCDPTLSIRGDEAEESWRIVEPIMACWAEGVPAIEEYPAGSAPGRPAHAAAEPAGPQGT